MLFNKKETSTYPNGLTITPITSSLLTTATSNKNSILNNDDEIEDSTTIIPPPMNVIKAENDAVMYY